MVVHTFGYRASISPNTETELSVIPDDILTRTTDTRFMIPAGLNKILWGIASANNLVYARLVTPSLITKKYHLKIFPHVRGSEVLSLTDNKIYKPSPPITLVPTEELSVKALQNGSASQYVNVVLTLQPDTVPPAPAGEAFWVRATASASLSGGKWETVKLTPDIQLDAGVYALTFAIAVANNALAVRFIIPGLVWRPGFPAISATSEEAGLAFANEFFAGVPEGEYGRFQHLAMPEAQFLTVGASTSQVVYLKLVKVG